MSRTDIHDDRILIIDFGGQTTQLIARRVRESGVYCEIHPWDLHAQSIKDFAPTGVILSGGPESTIEESSPRIAAEILALDVPVLGICYGMQAMVHQLGGRVEAHRGESEFGYASMRVSATCALFEGLSDEPNDTKATGSGETNSNATGSSLDVWMSHGDRVAALPAGFNVVGTSDNAPIAAMADAEQKRFGISFIQK